MTMGKQVDSHYNLLYSELDAVSVLAMATYGII